MVRSRTVPLCTLALWALCLVAATVGHASGARDTAPSASSPAFGILAPAADAAVLPAKVVDKIRVSAHVSTSRVLVLMAVPAVLISLAAVMSRRAAAAGRDHQRLRARRHGISLRAPPLQFA